MSAQRTTDQPARGGRTATRPQSPWLSLGRGGWSIHFPPYRDDAVSYGLSTLSHYGETWREHLDELAPGAIGTDTRPMSVEEVVTFSTAGPIGDPSVPAGCVKRLGGSVTPWRDVPIAGRDGRFGDARSLDCVALDVYVTILGRFGGRVFDPHET